MKTIAAIPALILVLMLSLPACADDVLPPPAVAPTSASQTGQSEATESAPNINDEFRQPDGNTAVDIRSYQRKDGATITEYGVRGKVFKIKVQPAGGMPAYYLFPDQQGHFVRRLPGGAKGITPPSWILKEF
ncbi:MAG: DUF2782 domain-containing protein [Mariprofundus sp.]